jgi:hypothetical protein
MNPLTRFRTIPHPSERALIWLLTILVGLLIEMGTPVPYTLIDNEAARQEAAVEQSAVYATSMDRADYLALLRGQLALVEPEPRVMMIEVTPDATYA